MSVSKETISDFKICFCLALFTPVSTKIEWKVGIQDIQDIRFLSIAVQGKQLDCNSGVLTPVVLKVKIKKEGGSFEYLTKRNQERRL